MDFNRRITKRILMDLHGVTTRSLSCTALEKNTRQNIEAVDNTFPIKIRSIIDQIFLKIKDHQYNQYCSTLNTPNEGIYDETLLVGHLFDYEISILEEYCYGSDLRQL